MDLFTFVIEDEEKFQIEIFRSLKRINPALKVRFFNSLESFTKWLGLFVKEGAAILETAGFRLPEDTEIEAMNSEKVIRLLIVKHESFAGQTIPLLGKTLDLFERKKVSLPDEKTSVVITAFDHSELDVKSLTASFVNNLIFKPFDTLILEEHLRFASIGHKKPNEANFKNNKLQAQVEMVKDIPVLGFSDLGFLTKSDRPLMLGEVGKFYSEEFTSETIKSVMARCVKTEPDPKNNKEFQCWMEYFGLETGQIKTFRKELGNDYPNSQIKMSLDLFRKNFVIIESIGEKELGTALKRFYPNSNAYHYADWSSFVTDFAPEYSDVIADKDLPIPLDYKLIIDISGHYILEQAPSTAEGNIFGDLFVEIKKKDFHSLLIPESKKIWMELSKTLKIDFGKEPLIGIQNHGKFHIVRLSKLSKGVSSNSMPMIELTLSEVSKPEKILFLKKLSPLPSQIDCVIGSRPNIKNLVDNGWLPNAKKYLLSDRSLSDSERKEWAKVVHDILYIPVDRNYLVKKIYVAQLGYQEWNLGDFKPVEKDIQSAQQIQIDEISEAGVTLKYHRPIDVGSFRRFYLWTPNELELRDYLASCNYFEEFKEGKTTFYSHHFVFYGMTDHYLKNIRLWVLENYIQSKSKDSS